jgi:two-component system, chemotaxis family, chemotaxis protein CheY
MKVLLAEDDRISRRILVSAVENLGHTAIQCSNGIRAWNIIEDNPDIDLLITDVMMPEMGGPELIQVLRGNSASEDLPVLVISGIIGPKAISEVLALGASEFYAKPVNVQALQDGITRVHKHLQRRAAKRRCA